MGDSSKEQIPYFQDSFKKCNTDCTLCCQGSSPHSSVRFSQIHKAGSEMFEEIK